MEEAEVGRGRGDRNGGRGGGGDDGERGEKAGEWREKINRWIFIKSNRGGRMNRYLSIVWPI